MAVYKSKRGESSVQFIETARQLEAHKLGVLLLGGSITDAQYQELVALLPAA